MNNIDISTAVQMISATAGQTFGVSFTKRSTGDLRKMACRLHVRKGVKGVGMAYDPASKGLLGVFDMNADGFRMINLHGLKSLTISGETYNVRG